MKNQPQKVSFISFNANGVSKICFAFNKLSVFKFIAEINSTFFIFRTDSLIGTVFFETISRTFSSNWTLQFLKTLSKNFVFGLSIDSSKSLSIKTLFLLLYNNVCNANFRSFLFSFRTHRVYQWRNVIKKVIGSRTIDGHLS